MTAIIKSLTYLVVTGIWVILGLYVSIPAIVLSTIVLPVAVISQIFGGGGTNAAGEFLETSVKMYPAGFRLIHRAVFDDKSHAKKDSGGSFSGGIVFAIIAVIGSTLFWWLVGYILSYVIVF